LIDDINAVHGGPKCIPTIIEILVATRTHILGCMADIRNSDSKDLAQILYWYWLLTHLVQEYNHTIKNPLHGDYPRCVGWPRISFVCIIHSCITNVQIWCI